MTREGQRSLEAPTSVGFSSCFRTAIPCCWSTGSSKWTATILALGIKNVTINEPFFQGHFPSHPIMPGVLLIEGMAQTAGALCVTSMEEQYEPSLVYFMAIDRARFRRPVIPGDTVYYHLKKIRNRGRVWRFKGEAKVDGTLVAEAEVSAMIVDPADLEDANPAG